MSILGKTILINIGIVIGYHLLFILLNRGASGEAAMGVALLSLMAITFHVFALLVGGVGGFIAKKPELGKSLLLSALIVLLVGFASCVGSASLMGAEAGYAERQSNDFYTGSKIEDLYRIPLIEPLEIISPVGVGSNWFIEFPYGEIADKEQVPVLSATVIDSVVLLQSDEIYFPKDSERRIAWFVIDRRDSSQEVYKTEGEFLQVLARRGIEKPVLYEVDSLYTQFQRTQRLPYFNN